MNLPTLRRSAPRAANMRGFTLVELSIVLVVVGLLFAAVVQGQQMVDRAKSQKLLNDLKTTEALVQKFTVAKGVLPGDCNGDGIVDFAISDVDTRDSKNGDRATLYNYTTVQPKFKDATSTPSSNNEACYKNGSTASEVNNTTEITNPNVWINDLKLAGLVSDSVPNRIFGKMVNEDFIFLGNINANSAGAGAKYNALVVYNVPQAIAKGLANAVNGTDASAMHNRIRVLPHSVALAGVFMGNTLTDVGFGSATNSQTVVDNPDAMYNVVYFFDRVPATLH